MDKIKELRLLMIVLLTLLIIQCFFYRFYKNVKPFIEIVPTPPNEKTIKTLTFGDDQFYFRIKSFDIQNMGDSYGRNTPLHKYNYKKLYYWLKFIDGLDVKSNYLVSLAAYYFSATQEQKDTIHLINFLEEHANYDLPKNWWWLYQATYMAKFVYKDLDLSIRLARKLRETSPDTAPLWTKRMESIYLLENNDTCEAIRIIQEILNDYEFNSTKSSEKNKEQELNYMRFFIEKNTSKLKENEVDFNKCFMKKEK